jgi:hypothetical protein
MRLARNSKRAVVLCLLMLVPSYSRQKDARAVWKDVLFKCAKSDLLGPKVFYFGPSNNYGPGVIWQKVSNGGYYPQWKLNNYVPNEKDVVNYGIPFGCSGSFTASSKFDPSLLLSTVPGSADFSADIQKARKVVVQVRAIRQDDLQGGPYKQKVSNLEPTSPIRKDLESDAFVVLRRAFLVQGLTADLEFTSDVALALKGKYKGKIGPSAPADFGVGLNAEWKSDTQLHLTSASDFYIGGELRPYKSGGLAATTEVFGEPVKGAERAKVVLKPTR